MEQHLDFLGWKVRDKITKFEGIVEHIGLDLYGCVQAIVKPLAVKEPNGAQTVCPGSWFDIARLEKVGEAREMEPIPVKGTELVAGAADDKPLK